LIAPIVPLTYYCLLIIAASILGGLLPQWVRLTHRRMQIAVSFVAAMMLGVGMLHMLGHALTEAQAVSPVAEKANSTVLTWMLAGCVTMFFIERFFCFHHHDVETDSAGHVHEHEEACHHHHGHDVTWGGAALGLTLHSLLEGVALAASLLHNHDNARLPGLGTFAVIFLHKPFDSMTIAMLMARGGWSPRWRLAVNGMFALAIPLGAGLVYAGLAGGASSGMLAVYALAFSAGTFLCISLSDLLPELQFHDHDRVKLSAALLLGLVFSVGIGRLESLVHRHDSNPPPSKGGVGGGMGEDGISAVSRTDSDVAAIPAD
jgi:zinc and cadmium transporter